MADIAVAKFTLFMHAQSPRGDLHGFTESYYKSGETTDSVQATLFKLVAERSKLFPADLVFDACRWSALQTPGAAVAADGLSLPYRPGPTSGMTVNVFTSGTTKIVTDVSNVCLRCLMTASSLRVKKYIFMRAIPDVATNPSSGAQTTAALAWFAAVQAYLSFLKATGYGVIRQVRAGEAGVIKTPVQAVALAVVPGDPPVYNATLTLAAVPAGYILGSRVHLSGVREFVGLQGVYRIAAVTGTTVTVETKGYVRPQRYRGKGFTYPIAYTLSAFDPVPDQATNFVTTRRSGRPFAPSPGKSKSSKG